MNTKPSITTTICAISALILLSCNPIEGIEFDVALKKKLSLLSVNEAQQLYEMCQAEETTRTQEEFQLPFSIGESAEPDWGLAILSANKTLSSVDIPLKNNDIYQIGKVDNSGNVNWTYTHSKLEAVKSSTTGESDIYVKIFIPNDLTGYESCNESLIVRIEGVITDWSITRP